MVLDSLLAGVMLFSSFAARTPNVKPNPDDYEVSIGLSHNNFHINRQWERELGEPYVDDLIWLKLDNQIYFKPEYMNKQSRDVKYLKIDWRSKWKDWSFGFTSRNDNNNLWSQNFETFDGYFPPNEEEDRDTFEFEDKFKVSWKLTDKIRIYNLGEISRLQGKEFYKTKIGFEYSF